MAELMPTDYGTDRDRSETYETDSLVRIIEDTIRGLRAEQRLYPDLYSEKLAEAIREAVPEREQLRSEGTLLS